MEKENRILCDHYGCEQLPVVNYQETTVRYSVDKDGNYGEPILLGTNGDSEHYCESHDPEYD